MIKLSLGPIISQALKNCGCCENFIAVDIVSDLGVYESLRVTLSSNRVFDVPYRSLLVGDTQDLSDKMAMEAVEKSFREMS